MSVHITDLRLSDIQIHRFGDLVSILLELHDLRKVRCEGITWAMGTPFGSLARRRPKLQLDRIYMANCTTDVYVAWLALKLQRHQAAKVFRATGLRFARS